MSKKPRRCGEQQLIFGYLKMGDCISGCLEDHVKLPSCWLSFMKGYVADTWGEGRLLIEP